MKLLRLVVIRKNIIKMKKLSDKEVIEKAVLKAEENGYKFIYTKKYRSDSLWHKLSFKGNYERFIFNHEFAKALFGTNQITIFTERNNEDYPEGLDYTETAYLYHIGEMAKSKHRIDYLRKFIEGKK